MLQNMSRRVRTMSVPAFPHLPVASHRRFADMKCVRLEASEANTDVETEIYGLAELARKDQVALKAELAKVDPPTHIQAIDPNDPEFLKCKVRNRTLAVAHNNRERER